MAGGSEQAASLNRMVENDGARAFFTITLVWGICLMAERVARCCGSQTAARGIPARVAGRWRPHYCGTSWLDWAVCGGAQAESIGAQSITAGRKPPCRLCESSEPATSGVRAMADYKVLVTYQKLAR